MEDFNDRVLERISLLLRGSLGAIPWSGSVVSQSGKLASWTPAVAGGVSGLIYVALFGAIPWLLPGSSDNLFWLSVWGGSYFAFAVATARSASSEVFQIIQTRVLPLLSPSAVAAIDRDLGDRFGNVRIQVVSLGSAMVAAVISVIAIRQDVFPTSAVMSVESAQITFCCIGFFFLFLTAARTTDVARFYSTFAAHLFVDSERIYALDPARSVLVTSVASIGRRVLLFGLVSRVQSSPC
jgi:hypothetical protein